MTLLIVLVLSILLQLVATFFAVRLIALTRYRAVWLLLAAAVFLMALRRCLSLIGILSHETSPVQLQLSAELIALAISFLLALGISRIGPVFRKVQESEESARRSEKKYHDLFAQANDAIFLVDLEGRYTDVNQKAVELLGFSREELLGMGIRDVIPPEQLERSNAELLKLRRTGRYEKFVGKIRTKDHRWLDVEVSSSAIWEDGQFAGSRDILRDISERVRVEKALEESEARFREIFRNMTSGMVIYQALEDGRDFRLLDLNRAAEQMERVNKKEVVGKSILEVFPGVQEFGLLPMLQRVWRTGQPEHLPVKLYRDDRLTGWRENAVFKLPAGEVVALYEDVTERKNLEDNLRQAQKMEAVGTLAGGIAHDFNNILFAILGYAQLAMAGVPRETEIHRHLEEVVKSGKRAANLVKQILTFSRQTEQERKPLQLQPVVKEAAKLLRETLPATIEIRQRIDSGCGQIAADIIQVHQVLMNLCTNAYHAMRPAGGVLEIGLREVSLEASRDRFSSLAAGQYVQLWVGDTGHGIPREAVDHIFEPYFTTKEAGEGTGLGLAIVHGIIKAHGGAIEVCTEVGAGTTFEILFPRLSGPAGESEEAPQVVELAAAGGHVLLVDDEEMIMRLGRKILEKTGYQVSAFTDSRQALAAFRNDPDSFDVVVTDMTMPHLTGAALAAEILQARPELPVILVTGYSELISEEQARELGIAEYIMKPLTLQELTHAVRRVLEGLPAEATAVCDTRTAD